MQIRKFFKFNCNMVNVVAVAVVGVRFIVFGIILDSGCQLLLCFLMTLSFILIQFYFITAALISLYVNVIPKVYRRAKLQIGLPVLQCPSAATYAMEPRPRYSPPDKCRQPWLGSWRG